VAEKIRMDELKGRQRVRRMGAVTGHDYRLRSIDTGLWQRVLERAETEGRPIRFVMIKLLEVYAEHGFNVVEAFDGRNKKR
jgi:hypothetical protein